MVERACVKRLQKEYHALCKVPVPQVVARPSPNDILEWHYVLEGSQGTAFSGGCYYGKIKFPPEYPYKPPSISMTTPNGRFAPNKKICLSMSDFHPESWNPIWSVSSILTGLLSFMMDNDQTTGSIQTSDDVKRKLARLSLAYNCESKNCPNFKKLFPEYVEKYNQQLLVKESTPNADLLQKQSATHKAPSTAAATTMVAGEERMLDGVTQVGVEGRRTKQLPSWLLIIMISALSVVMALPLLQP